MRLTNTEIQQLANALAKQAEIIHKAGADALANALCLRARSLELAVIPVEPEFGPRARQTRR